ncbi:MAG: hypothetical protein V1492_05945 [Candidatus Micrarchaeota archaeon]
MREKDCPVCEDPIFVTAKATKVCETCSMGIASPAAVHFLKIGSEKKYFCKKKCLVAFKKANF